MIYLFWCAMLAGLALAFGAYFKKGLEETFAPAAFTSVLVLYLFGLLGFLQAGLWLVAGLGLCGIIFWLVCAARKKSWLLYSWLTPGSLILIFAILYIAWMQGGKLIMDNDEFSHWGFAVKVMHHTDELGVFHPDVLGFAAYPPATSLFQYLFVRLTPTFTEGYLFRAEGLLAVSLLLPVLAHFSWKKFGTALLSGVTLALLPLIFYPDFYSNLQVDGLLGLMQCYLLYVWLSSRRADSFTLLQLTLGCAVLTLTKESGILLALLTLAIILYPWIPYSHR